MEIRWKVSQASGNLFIVNHTCTQSSMENSTRSNNDQHAAANTERPVESAHWHLPSHMRLWLVAVIGLTIDLWSKAWAFTHLDANPDSSTAMVIIPHVMTFRRSLNTGALFGLGKGMTPLFIGASVLALGFVLLLFVHSTKDRKSLHIALGLVLAGALGNLYDRSFAIADVVRYSINDRTYSEACKRLPDQDTELAIMVGTWPEGQYKRPVLKESVVSEHQQGVVRDFIKMEPKFTLFGQSIQIWPWVFNIADALLVVGVGLLMLNFWWERKAEIAAKVRIES